MLSKLREKYRYEYESIKICFIYFVIGVIWIYFSDRLVNIIALNSKMVLILSTYKGWAYVLITTIILFLLINNFLNKISIANMKINESYSKLELTNEELEASFEELTASEEELKYQYDQITESERKLRISEERYRALVKEMEHGIAVYECENLDQDVNEFKFIYANESHERIMKKNTCENLGKTLKEFLPELNNEIISMLNIVVKSGVTKHYEHHLDDIDRDLDVIAYRPQQFQIAVIVTDITARKKAEEALINSERNFKNIFENSSDAILLIENDVIVDCNIAVIKLFISDSKSSIIGKSPDSLSVEYQSDGQLSINKIFDLYREAYEFGKCRFEWWFKGGDDKTISVEVMMTKIYYNNKPVFHCLMRDISDRKQMERKLEYLSYNDQLTGLYNRRFFENELLTLDAEINLPLSIIMADVNGLKLINDSFGHSKGDELLKKVASVLKIGFRKNDIIARLGGDEFVVLLPNTSINTAEELIKNMETLTSNEKLDNIDISISFGYHTKISMEENINDCLKKAEDYMYKKKLFEGPSMRGRTINAIITALHEKNKREEQHSYRVSKLCESMGIALGLTQNEIKELKTVGLLHDIGKIAIDENILNKPGRLTHEEFEEVKRHPEIGYRILSTVNDMSEMAEYVLAHHEKYDGSGYPKGLVGDKIPLQSRIIAIADTYDAIISERSYRNALSEEYAVEELKRFSGSQFDADLVKVFIEKILNL